MGAVAMESKSLGFLDRGYPVSEATIYIYCDKCGSFNVKTYIKFWKLMISGAILTFVVYFVSKDGKNLYCILPLILFAMYIPWRDIFLSYKCRKCRNKQISDRNILRYPSYNKSVIDVPDRLTQKRYIHEDVLHFSQFT